MWNEIKSLWRDGLAEYVTDSWNIIDFVATSLYLCDIAVKIFLNFTKVSIYSVPIIFTLICAVIYCLRDQLDP